MTEYGWFWLLWIAGFLVMEIRAVRDPRPMDTLSEHVWAVFSIKGKGRAWRLRRFALLSFMAWLAVHMLTGGTY